MYTITKIYIDSIFAILIISCFSKNPKPEYFKMVNQILIKS